MKPKDIARFEAKFTKDDGGCWLWHSTKNHLNYGMFWLSGKYRGAHRVSYELYVGPIPKGLTLDHVKMRGCQSTLCVRPSHLEPVTMTENIMRGVGVSAVNAKKTHCPKGHPYSGHNLIVQGNGDRACRTCRNNNNRIWMRAYYQKKRGA